MNCIKEKSHLLKHKSNTTLEFPELNKTELAAIKKEIRVAFKNQYKKTVALNILLLIASLLLLFILFKSLRIFY